MLPSTRIDRARGCLLGLAVGDALGATLEGLSPQQIRAHYGQVADYVDGAIAWKKKPYRWRLPGSASSRSRPTTPTTCSCDTTIWIVRCGLFGKPGTIFRTAEQFRRA